MPYWRGGLVSGARTQHPKPGVLVSARLLIPWVTLNNVTFLVPHLRVILCEMNVHVCLCSSRPKAVESSGSCPRVRYPGSALGGCSFRKGSCTRLAPKHSCGDLGCPALVCCIRLVRTCCWRVAFLGRC